MQTPAKVPAAEVVNLAALVNYQEHSIVSREIMRCPTGTVTVFAFDEGQRLSEHTSAYNAMLQLLEGDADITIAGRTFRVEGGAMILLPANQPHAVTAAKRFKMILTLMRS
jgi:quercetin dioxygenase-like cupin family protein